MARTEVRPAFTINQIRYGHTLVFDPEPTVNTGESIFIVFDDNNHPVAYGIYAIDGTLRIEGKIRGKERNWDA